MAMSFSRNVATALLGVCVLVSGCSGEGEPDEVPFESISVPSTTLDYPVTGNGLRPLDFWVPANQQALRSLGAAALLDAGGTLVPTPLLNTEGGRSVLRYAVQCALNDDTTVQRAASAFTGELNLAPAWASRALNTSEQRWLTACLLDHLNGLGASVSMAMVGRHPALVADPGVDSSEYTINDVTGFGNLFLPNPTAYVCPNLGINLACGVELSTYTLLRICGLSPTCGAAVLLPCAPLICSRDGADNPTCSFPLLFGATYPEAISTKLKRNVALSLYPLCSLL